MSGFEIERKFLVKKGGAFKRAAFSSSHIQQGYIPCLNATVRIRVRDDEAYLTIKGKSTHGGDNEGLVMAEVELKSEDEPYEKPDFIGPEVTGDVRFYNKYMLTNPFSAWKDTLPEEYR